MSPSKKQDLQEEKAKKSTDGPALNMNHWHRYWVVSATTLGCIFAFAAAGYILDTLSGSGKHWIMVSFILVSFPFTQILLIKRMRKYTKEHFANYKAKQE